MMEPGDTACSGAEGAAETLRQRGPVLDETPESERARTDEAIPTRRIFQVNTNSSWNACAFFQELVWVTEAQNLTYMQELCLCFVLTDIATLRQI